MNPVHRSGLAVAALATALTLGGALVAQGYYAAMAEATAAPTAAAPTEAATPEPTATSDVQVVYVAAPTPVPTAIAKPAVRPVSATARTTRAPQPAVTPEPGDHGSDD